MSQVVGNGIIAGASYALIALGFGLIYNVAGFFHFTHGAVYAVGAYVAYATVIVGGHSLLAGILVGTICAVGLGCLIDVLFYLPLRKRSSSSTVLFLASLGILICVQNALSLLFQDQPRILRTFTIERGILILGARMTSAQIWIVVSAVLLSLGTWLLLHRTALGLNIRAVANDAALARCVGIQNDKTRMFAFAVGSGLASVAGIMVSIDSDLTPSMGFHALLMGIPAAIVGGVGSVPGAIAGGLLVGLARHIGVWALPTEWQDAIVFIILILFLVMRPQGFFGAPLRRTSV